MQAENLRDEFGHRIADQHPREHELITRIGLDLVDLGLEPHERRGRGGLVEPPHLVLDAARQIGQQVRDRRIDRDLAHAFGEPVLASRRQQAFGEDVAIVLRFGAAGGDENLAVFLEVHQPVRHVQVGNVEQQADVPERGGIFAVRIDHHYMPVGRGFADLVED